MVDRNSWEQTLGSAMSPGDVVAGKYRVERVVGRGGMGVVVQAWHLDFDEPVAIKFLLPDMVQSEEALGRFEREARANFKIKSEHVAHVIDVGKTDAGVRFMVMEYLDGSDLADVLARDKRVPFAEAVDYILQACDAVAEAHANGIVHRDLKPENIFVTQRPDGSACIKVLDFGLSKVQGGSRERPLTSTFQLMGTPQYMSPEQWMSASDVGPSSDLWALGVILYELIAGVTPFRGEKLAEVCAKVMEGEPPPIASYGVDVPPALERVIHACLRKQPKERLANVGDLAVKLHPFAQRNGRLAAKRASGVLRTAGYEVQGTIPSVTIAPRPPEGPKPSDKDPLATTELMGDEHMAAEVQRAHAALAARERALAGAAASGEGAALRDDATTSGDALPDLEPRVSVTTIVMSPEEADIPPARSLARRTESDDGRADHPTLMTIAGPVRARAQTPTSAYETAPEIPLPKGPAIPFVSADETRRMSDLPGALASSPWATGGDGSSGQEASLLPSGTGDALEATFVGTGLRPARRTDYRRKQARWFALVVVLAVCAGVLSVLLVVHSLTKESASKAPPLVSATPLGAASADDPIPDPVPSPRATSSSDAASSSTPRQAPPHAPPPVIRSPAIRTDGKVAPPSGRTPTF